MKPYVSLFTLNRQMKLRYPIRHIQLMLQGILSSSRSRLFLFSRELFFLFDSSSNNSVFAGIKPKPGDISQKKEEKGKVS